MNGSKESKMQDEERRRLLACLLTGGVIAAVPLTSASDTHKESSDEGPRNNLMWAVAWKQTAAEYRALCYQAYNFARMRLDAALQRHKPGDRPLAVITDMDDTMLHVGSYWGHLVNENKDFFDDSIWDEWLPKNQVTAVPGSREFFGYCSEQGVEVFYVTSRNQGVSTREYALAQLKYLEMPFADEAHLFVFTDSSDKTPAREKISADFDVAVLLGDNLNDYKRDYYVKNVEERLALMERDREDWGRKFILLPNPTDGHWVRAIFGESEPLPTDENRRKLKTAATRLSWDGR